MGKKNPEAQCSIVCLLITINGLSCLRVERERERERERESRRNMYQPRVIGYRSLELIYLRVSSELSNFQYYLAGSPPRNGSVCLCFFLFLVKYSHTA